MFSVGVDVLSANVMTVLLSVLLCRCVDEFDVLMYVGYCCVSHCVETKHLSAWGHFFLIRLLREKNAFRPKNSTCRDCLFSPLTTTHKRFCQKSLRKYPIVTDVKSISRESAIRSHDSSTRPTFDGEFDLSIIF
jgi:hypothetical protein